MKVTKVYKEKMPDVKLVGKRYTNEDHDETGSFAVHWQQWFLEGWFETLKQCKPISGVSDDSVGAMRMVDGGGFEYWIGLLLDPDSEVPEGFESIDIPSGDIGVCWLYGNEATGELYSSDAFDMAVAAFAEEGWTFSEKGWFLERYNTSRFTEPDEEGNIILDLCAYLL